MHTELPFSMFSQSILGSSMLLKYLCRRHSPFVSFCFGFVLDSACI